jgi:hypothetical protein
MLDLPAGRWTGLDGLGEEALKELRPTAEAAVLRAALLFTGELKKTLSGPRHGRAYKVSRTGALHIASAPGEPPAVLYGRLRQSIDWIGPTWDGWTVSAEVGTNVEYGALLEFGGLTGRAHRTRILARPWMEPTVLRITPAIEQILEAG